MEYCAGHPVESSVELSRAVTKPFMAPLFHESCCGSQLWLVEGSFWALVLVRVGVERVQVPGRIVRVRLLEDARRSPSGR